MSQKIDLEFCEIPKGWVVVARRDGIWLMQAVAHTKGAAERVLYMKLKELRDSISQVLAEKIDASTTTQ